MPKLVLPEVYFVGFSCINFDELERYLRETDQASFLEEIAQARSEKLSDGEILCSFYAKACYAALTTTKNKNISRVRGIHDNVLGTIVSGHGSVFEHCSLNFMITNCSRVLTHELVRHRAGVAFSQSSGRYIRTDRLDFIHDPILDVVKDDISGLLSVIETKYKELEEKVKINEIKDFGVKKRITSALRRILPNGQSNEIGFSVNLRALRHTIELRTSEHAEWEIRIIFNKIFNLVKDKYPAIFADAQIKEVLGANEITFKNKKI